MKRRSFIATLAAGIAGLFVPLPKAERPVLVAHGDVYAHGRVYKGQTFKWCSADGWTAMHWVGPVTLEVK